MESFPLILIFWYGILHAFGPDHLTAIVDFSLGKSRAKTLFITFSFAIGHGISLFIFAKLLDYIDLGENILAWGDIVSSSVILAIGLFLLFMVATNRINVGWHTHKGKMSEKKHIHIYFGKEHNHSDNTKRVTSALTIGVLMGIGGVRGMLVTLSSISHDTVNLFMVLNFTFGVMLVFMIFGYFLGLVNDNLLKTKQNVRVAFGVAGIISVAVGGSMFF